MIKTFCILEHDTDIYASSENFKIKNPSDA